MARVELFTEREQTEGAQTEAFDHITASRGSVPLPLSPLINAPGVAVATADLGWQLRNGVLQEPVRELVIATTARQRGCAFEWEVHSKLALASGVDEGTIDAVRRGADPEGDDFALVEFVRTACATGAVSEEMFDQVRVAIGDEGVVEIVALIGYYSYLALVMSVLELE